MSWGASRSRLMQEGRYLSATSSCSASGERRWNCRRGIEKPADDMCR
eukprot:CAMPEP_0196664680 /NCGR_PEP_ID=MMETSP1086-20130531/57976_1 /TAXON_ID=77921 /ORGANISM="Cyanoptyche  gloeocystis , Strain SAG4.97" /LENGTH=46 /DNA_ID= /DNA_START= /DNA_END= /DNA_ORIENTATION=